MSSERKCRREVKWELLRASADEAGEPLSLVRFEVLGYFGPVADALCTAAEASANPPNVAGVQKMIGDMYTLVVQRADLAMVQEVFAPLFADSEAEGDDAFLIGLHFLMGAAYFKANKVKEKEAYGSVMAANKVAEASGNAQFAADVQARINRLPPQSEQGGPRSE